MKIEFLKRKSDSTRLILIYAGWSAGPAIARDIDLTGWDVAVVHDYTDFNLDFSFLDEYYTVYLFAWSLGVFAAEKTVPAHKITSAFAINGTSTPVDDSLGIPRAIFRGTADGLNPRNLLKFRMRMMTDSHQWRRYSVLFDEDADETRINNLQRQLYNFMTAVSNADKIGSIDWIRAYIGTEDRIFPPQNMLSAWKNSPDTEIVCLRAGHYVDINEIVKSAVPDLLQVSQKFTRAAGSYNLEAIAQYGIARRLAANLNELNPPKGGDILEIGCGTGLFTQEYADILKPLSATFVDIAQCGPFDICKSEQYFTEDAEKWISQQERKWDVILSASCIQWFSNIPRFLEECHQHLKPDGILAISTFLPGNLKELDAGRPSPIIYPEKSDLLKKLITLFREVAVTDEEIVLEFKSHRDMLMHLKHTGVGGSSNLKSSDSGSAAKPTVLTYKPVYLICRK